MTCKGCDTEMFPMGQVITRDGLCVMCEFEREPHRDGIDWERIKREIAAVHNLD